MIPPGIEIHPLAIREARAAFWWYNRRSPSAARRFRAALLAALQQIAEHPKRWPRSVGSSRYRILRRFPYIVVYRQSATDIEVVAIAHSKRKPGYWRRR